MPGVTATGSGSPQCTVDGMLLPDCELVHNLLASGAALPSWLADMQRRPGFEFRPLGLGLFRYYVPNPSTLEDQIGGNNDEDDDEAVRVNSDVPAGTWRTFAVWGEELHQSGKVPLTDRDRMWYEGRRRYALELLGPGTKCGNFLAANFDYTEVARALKLQRPFDGLRSTLTIEQAGIVSPGFGSDKFLRQIANKPVNEYMIGNRAATAMNNPATRYDVYFNPNRMSALTLIHEALHSATLLNDYDLAKKLTGIDFQFNRDGSPRRYGGRDASVTISEILARNGCGTF